MKTQQKSSPCPHPFSTFSLLLFFFSLLCSLVVPKKYIIVYAKSHNRVFHVHVNAQEKRVIMSMSLHMGKGLSCPCKWTREKGYHAHIIAQGKRVIVPMSLHKGKGLSCPCHCTREKGYHVHVIAHGKKGLKKVNVTKLF